MRDRRGRAGLVRPLRTAGRPRRGLLGPDGPAGLATVLGTTSLALAGRLAALANVLVIQEPGLAGQLDLPGPAQSGQFVLAVKGPPGQVRAACRFVPGEVR